MIQGLKQESEQEHHLPKVAFQIIIVVEPSNQQMGIIIILETSINAEKIWLALM